MYAFAFVQSIESLTLPMGIAKPVECIVEGAIAAVVEPTLNLDTLQNDDDVLLQAVIKHDHVIQTLFAQTTVLPLRFGTYFVSREALVHHLQGQGDRYLAKLQALAGKAEYTVQLTPIDLAPPSAARSESGRSYFLAKKQHYQLQQEQQQQRQESFQILLSAIAQHFPDCRIGEPKEGMERLYVLLPTSQEGILQSLLTNWSREATHWSVEVNTPLPPYHFAAEL